MNQHTTARCILHGVFVLLLLIGLQQKVHAQLLPPTEFTVGYFGPTPSEPGVRMGLHSPAATRAKGAIMFNVHMAFFMKNRDNSNLLLGMEIGWRWQNEESKNLHTISFGSAYQFQSEVTGFTVDLQGNITEREREGRGIFLPTLNYEYGRKVNDRWGPYAKLGYGYKLSQSAPNAGVFMNELGVRWWLSNSNDNG